jgi:ribokinase
MKKIFILGSINIDLSINCEKFPIAGETVIGNNFIANTGGKGANQAVAVSKMGGNATFLGATGNDFWGNELKNSLTNYHVNCQHLITKPCSSGVAVIVINEGNNRIIIDSGANYQYEYEDFSEILQKEAKPGDFFITQLENRIDVVEKGLKLAKSLGMVTILNPAPDQPLNETIYENCDYLIPNEIEGFSLAGLNLDIANISKVFDFFLSKKVKNVIITLGKNGCAYNKEGKIYFIKAIEEEVVDTTAAGDTFVGAFAVRLMDSNNIEEAVKYANCASALTITKHGAQKAIPTKSQIEEFLKKFV